jgi:thiamine-phosphate pyrophosphorylase
MRYCTDIGAVGFMGAMVKVPKLYAIVDRETLDKRGIGVRAFAEELRDGGVRLVQYRDKKNGPQEVLRAAGEIAAVFEGVDACLILNDRADLAALLGWGVHVGQEDLSPEDARMVLGAGVGVREREGRKGIAKDAKELVGVSTHTMQQVMTAERGVALHPMSPNARDMGHPDYADYVAIGPVFATATKSNAEPVVGLEGVRRARELTKKPLVAIGGIGLGNARSVIDAGADSVAVISGLIVDGRRVRDVTRDFLEILG